MTLHPPDSRCPVGPEDIDGRIRHIRYAAGLALEEDANAPDPMACYRVTKEGKGIRVSFSEGRAFWRELPALVSLVLSLHPCPTRDFSSDLPTWEMSPPALGNLIALRRAATGYNDLYSKTGTHSIVIARW